MPRPRRSAAPASSAGQGHWVGFAGAGLGALVLAGCAAGSAAAPTTAPSATPATAVPGTTPTGLPDATPAPAPAREITVAVTDGKVTPRTRRIPVQQGERVRIQVTSDVADELHVHGYDREVALPAGRAATVEFVADEQGLFEVETHESGLTLFSLLVR